MAEIADGARILIDGTMARGGGGFTYLVNILPNLARRSPNTRFRVLVRSDCLARSLPPLPNLEVVQLPPVGILGRLRFTYLEAPRMARAWGADLYFCAGESVPLGLSCPSIASLQNPNPFTQLDQGWPWKQRLRLATLRWLARLSAWAADRVMFVSHDSAAWMGDFLGLAEHRRAAIPHGIDPTRWAAARESAPSSDRYVLSVSSIYRYKNFVRLIEAYAELARRRPDVPDLLIVGDDQDPDYSRKMQEAREATGEVAERIHILGEVPYADIQTYYANAELFVFPSYLETFGLPLLEAMASGVPVVASDIPVFRETGDDAAFYADPYDVGSLARAMEEALAPEAQKMLVKRGHRVVEHYSWDRTSRLLLNLFAEILEEQPIEEAQHPLPIDVARVRAREGLTPLAA